MKRKLLLSFAVLLAVITAFSACGKKDEASSGETDRATKVISIGDDSVSLAMYEALFDNYYSYMTSYQELMGSDSSLASFRNWITDILAGNLVTLHQAKLAGFKLDQAKQEEVERSVEEELKQIYDSFMKIAEQDYQEDPSIPVKTYFEGIVNTESEYYTGIAMSWEDYRNYLMQESLDAELITAYREKVCEEFAPTDDNIRSWYDSACEQDRQNYITNPEKYKTDEEELELNGVSGGASPITYVPSGYSRVMLITVSPRGELSNEYRQKIARMEEIKAEYAELSFEDAVNSTDRNAARLSELLNEYRALKASTDTEYDAFLTEAREKIDDALMELHSGRDFYEVMLEFTEDENVAAGCFPKGELISLEYTSSRDFSDGIKAEFSKLKLGQYSNVFMDGESYHIIYYASDEASGEVPIEDMYDDIKVFCTADVQDKMWEKLLSEWLNDPELIINEDLIKTVTVKK